MQGRFQHNDNRFGAPNHVARQPHLGNEFQNAPRFGFGNREPPRFPQDQSQIFSPPAVPFSNTSPGSHPQQRAQNNVNYHNPLFNPNTPVINPHIPPPPMIDNIQFQNVSFPRPVSHIQQQAPVGFTRNASVQRTGMPSAFPRNDVPDFLKMQQSWTGNSKWIQSDEEINQEKQQSNAEVIFPPSNFPEGRMEECTQFPPYHLDDGFKNPIMFDSQNSVENHMQFTKDNREQNKPLNRTKQASQEWVNRWLEQIGKSSSEHLTKSSPVPECRTLKICEAQERVKQMVFLLAKLKQETAYLESLTYDSDEWKTHAEKAKQLQIQLRQHQEVMTDEAKLSDLQQRVSNRRKKRLRQKEVKKERYEDREKQMTEREELHKMIDNWQARIQKEESNKKQEKDLKAAADTILSEVRKKIADAVKTIDLLKGLQKLRKLRKDRLSRQGITVPIGSDTKFEEQISQQIKTMQSQKEVYLAEEKTLKVMLEVEQEETKEKERELILKIKKQKAEREERKMNIKMFGPSEAIQEDDPIFPYFQYYDQANQAFEAFLQIRRDWDMFLVPDGTPGGSRIPDGFVLPSEPSSEAWATALKDE
ncbi:programmed cell death protein 7-like [Pecten maximus]|uniref:programmed cell death protein 7-like n=1 Tax=Pecten maximus TaxID=6579 RepID=UPI001457F770|nr:programmed cell death protein 7-like [Pecten maximus]